MSDVDLQVIRRKLIYQLPSKTKKITGSIITYGCEHQNPSLL